MNALVTNPPLRAHVKSWLALWCERLRIIVFVPDQGKAGLRRRLIIGFSGLGIEQFQGLEYSEHRFLAPRFQENEARAWVFGLVCR